MPKVRMTLGIGIANANQEEIIDIYEHEWNDCETDKEREDLLEQCWQDWMGNYLDGGYEVIDE